MNHYTGSITINGIPAQGQLAVFAEPILAYGDELGHAHFVPRYDWRGTLQLDDPARAPELIGAGDGIVTLALPDGDTARAVQTSLDSRGTVELEGAGPWFTEVAA